MTPAPPPGLVVQGLEPGNLPGVVVSHQLESFQAAELLRAPVTPSPELVMNIPEGSPENVSPSASSSQSATEPSKPNTSQE